MGDYRIIYTFDVEQKRIHLLAIGHRREITDHKPLTMHELKRCSGRRVACVPAVATALRVVIV